MNNSDFSNDDLEVLQTLAYFYFKVNLFDSAMRTVKVMLVVDPGNVWAKGMLVRCYDRISDYKQVVNLTDDSSFFVADLPIYRATLFLRARALHKLGRYDEAQIIIRSLIKDGGL